MNSRIPGFYKLAPADRIRRLAEAGGPELAARLAAGFPDGLTLDAANVMVENVVSTFSLPNAVAVNFQINGQDRLVPMVVEEPSVVAAVTHMAKLARDCGGFAAESDPSHMVGQIQLMNVRDVTACVAALEAALPALHQDAAGVHPRLDARGGGLVGFDIRTVTYDEPGRPIEHMVVLHVVLDVVDAMGANMVNTLCEHLAPTVAELTGCQVGLRILSNLADRRCARARVTIPAAALDTPDMSGQEVAERIAAAWRFAWADPYRAATHNKGIMNGIDAVAIATGNDWRAIEAGAHAFCCRDGQYRPLSRWEVDAESGDLHGSIEIPMQFGTVGGTIRVHPTVQANLAILGTTRAADLAAVAAAVGLAQNLGALKALATEGIQYGHMRMHARTVAATAGATPEEVSEVTVELVHARDFSVARARSVLARLRAS